MIPLRLFYNILFTFFFALSAPYYFLKMWRRGNWQNRFGQRFGQYSPEEKASLAQRPSIWFHAVSVGEVGVCVELIRALEPLLGQLQIVVSTTTSTGMAELERKLPAHVQKIYYPIDSWWVVRQALKVVNPKAVVLVEAEIWPNFLWQVLDRKLPLFLVNARVSERSFRGYKRFSFLFRKLFSQFTAAGCQDATDAGRLAQLGFVPSKVHPIGNLKFDTAKLDERQGLDVRGLLAQIGVPPNARLLVGGSTHDGEELILAEMASRLRQRFPDLFPVLVPRHFERAKDIGAEFSRRNIRFVFRSDITPGTQPPAEKPECLIVNTDRKSTRLNSSH